MSELQSNPILEVQPSVDSEVMHEAFFRHTLNELCSRMPRVDCGVSDRRPVIEKIRDFVFGVAW